MKNSVMDTQVTIDNVLDSEFREFMEPVVSVLRSKGYKVAAVTHRIQRPKVPGRDCAPWLIGRVWLRSVHADDIQRIMDLPELRQYDMTEACSVQKHNEVAEVYGTVPFSTLSKYVSIIIPLRNPVMAGSK